MSGHPDEQQMGDEEDCEYDEAEDNDEAESGDEETEDTSFVTVQYVQENVDAMKNFVNPTADNIYKLLLPFLEGKMVIQFQIYGIGPIWKHLQIHQNSNGAFQLAVAFNLIERFKQVYANLDITSQDPIHLPAEVTYLRNNNIRVSESQNYDSKLFTELAANATGNPVMICYMIHFEYDEFEKFLAAHWNSEILSRIIFVGTVWSSDFYDGNKKRRKCQKSKEFFNFITNDNQIGLQKLEVAQVSYNYAPFLTNEFNLKLNDLYGGMAFNATYVYSLSLGKAQELVQKVG